MKKRINTSLVAHILTLTLLFSCTNMEKKEAAICQDLKPTTRSNASWDYPVKPGMDEWDKLTTEKERIAVLQVPESILARLTTEEVVELCITFPHFGLFTAFQTPQDGFDIMVERYNLFPHLLKLHDAGKCLIPAYKDAGMSGFNSLPYSNEFWTIKIYYVELLLSQKEVLEPMVQEEKLELLIEARKKIDEKIVDDSFSSVPGIEPTLRIMASILALEEYPEFVSSPNKQPNSYFIQTGRLGDLSSINEIIRIADAYIISNTQSE
ncbi:MAG: hypothetical protein LBC84_03485 [Prevotellaceae bacterium]|nr:hypothetical protein [Prevotellaceae bacterium]